jgi:glutaredoxin
VTPSPYAGPMADTTGTPGGPRVLLLGKPGCHLCDDAREVVGRVAGELGVAWEERDITASEEDTRLYWDQIPVTFVDGVQHDFWRVDEQRLRAALTA